MALCSELRSDAATEAVPIMFLCSRNSVDTKVTAFGLGADDFVDKPFDAAELRAGSARGCGAARERPSMRVIGPLRIDRGRFKASGSRTAREHELDLTAHELRLLVALAETPGSRTLARRSSRACWSATARSRSARSTPTV